MSFGKYNFKSRKNFEEPVWHINDTFYLCDYNSVRFNCFNLKSTQVQIVEKQTAPHENCGLTPGGKGAEQSFQISEL